MVLAHEPLHLLEGVVEEIVRRLGGRAVDRRRRMAAGGDDLALGDEVRLDHVGQDLVGAGARRRQVDVRGIFRRRLEQAGQHRRLGHGDVADVLVEVEFRRRRRAEGAAAHIGAVEIHREDLALGQMRLQPEREEGFLDLAVEGALVRQEEVLGELLRQGRPALDDAARAGVLGHGAGEAEEVDAPMLEEAAVLGREHRLDEDVRHLVDRHGRRAQDAAAADLLAVAVEEQDGVVGFLRQAVRRHLHRRLGQRQEQDEAGEAERQRLAGELEEDAVEAPGAELARQDRDGFPPRREGVEGTPEAGVDPGIHLHEARRLAALGLAVRIVLQCLPVSVRGSPRR